MTSNYLQNMKKEVETLIHAVRIYIGHRNGIRHKICAKLVMKCSKRHGTDEMELPNHNKVRTLGEKETYKYLGILEANSIKTSGNERQNSKRIYQKKKSI